jgi:AraC family transcriptional activator of pobA
MAVDVLTEIPGVNMEDLRLKGFKVHELPVSVDIPISRGRRDFYKMGLVTGEMTVAYGDQILELNDTVLFFVNPHVPRSVVRRSTNTTGYACIFTETFITGREQTEVLKNSPLFHTCDIPVIALNSEQAAFMWPLHNINLNG